MARMKLRSPAKINLYLNVLGKRPDGYHDLDTLFERVSLFDRIDVSLARSGITVRCDSRRAPGGPTNIAYRAAALLLKESGVKKGARISIQKNIPVAAGLGGGSSNAATVLEGLNRLWRLGYSRKKLMALGVSLGSDVPFFLLGARFARGVGRGEGLKRVSPPAGLQIWHCLVKPDFAVSTKEAYSRLKGGLTPPKTDAKMLLHSIHRGQRQALSKLLTNSLEVTLNKRVTTILKIKHELAAQGALGALMSGSGSSVFGIFKSRKKAARAARYLKKKHKRWQVFVASTY